jgi:hypothetical protein
VAKIMQCDCGYVVRGETDDELVATMSIARALFHGMVEITREWYEKSPTERQRRTKDDQAQDCRGGWASLP